MYDKKRRNRSAGRQLALTIALAVAMLATSLVPVPTALGAGDSIDLSDRLSDVPAAPQAAPQAVGFVTIVDNESPGFSTVNVNGWTAFNNQGFLTGIVATDPQSTFNNGDKAIWTVTGLAPGAYQIAATWSHASDRANPAPYTVFDGATSVGTVNINQKLAPSGISDKGVGWTILGTTHEVTSGVLKVELSDVGASGGDYLIADAVRIAFVAPLANTVSGVVYKDSTWNGEVDGVGLAGVVVTAYDAAGAVVDTQVTATGGGYVLAVPDGTPVRVEFTNLPSSVGYAHAASRTETQFATSPASDVNLGVSAPCDFCETEPKAAIPTWRTGVRSGVASSPGVLGFPYWNDDCPNLNGCDTNQTLATIGAIGATWGLAWDRERRLLYVGSVLKRHSDFGPDGPGAIYVVDYSDPNTPVVLAAQTIDLAALGIDVGTIGPRGLAPGPNSPDLDPEGWTKSGKMSLGDLDINAAGTRLYVMNLFERELVEIDVSVPAAPAVLASYPVVDPGCTATTNEVQIIDDGDAGFAAVGWLFTSHPDGYLGDYQSTQAGDTTKVAIWTFTVTPNQPYQVAVAWPGSPSGNVPDAPYSVFDGAAPGGTALGTVTRDQTLGVGGYGMGGTQAGIGANNSNWSVLGEYTSTTGTLRIELRSTATASSRYVRADAVRIRRNVAAPAPAPDDYRPWAVKVAGDDVYIGVTCSAETSQEREDLHAYVQKLDRGSNTFVPVTDLALTYPRATIDGEGSSGAWADWRPWTDAEEYNSHTGPAVDRNGRAEPILSDIEFDDDGSLIVGFVDRFALKTGWENWFPSGDPEAGVPGGEILRFCKVGASYYLEGTAQCPTNLPNGYGPGGGEFYWSAQLGGANTIPLHGETALGGIAFLPGSGEILTGLLDPIDFFGNGVGWLSNSDGSRVDSRTLPVIVGKGAGLGDIEILCAPGPLEIGNRVWHDLNVNGVQDAGEAAIPGVVMELYKNGAQVSTATTNGAGEYYFRDSGDYAPRQQEFYFDPVATTGTWTQYGGTMSATAAGAGNSVTWTFADLMPGTYQVLVGWTSNGATNETTNMGIQIKDGATVVHSGTLNQDTSDQDSAFIGHMGWASVGTMLPVTSGTLTLVQTAGAAATSYVERVLVKRLDAVDPDPTDFLGELFGADQFERNTTGVYEVRVAASNFTAGQPLDGLFATLPNAAPDNRDSDGVTLPSGALGASVPTASSGQNDHTWDFGFSPTPPALVAVGNLVWSDDGAGGGTASDGIANGAEAGIDGVLVYLYAAGDTPGISLPIRTTTTAGGGFYLFDDLAPGQFFVHIPASQFGPTGPLANSTSSPPQGGDDANDDDVDENGQNTPVSGGISSNVFDLQPGAEPTGETGRLGGPPSNQSDASTNLTVDFGFVTPLGAIGNYVWVDENSDGYQDEGEPGIPNVQINLYTSAGVFVETTYTDSHGGYLFDNLKPGSYFVDVLDGTGNQPDTLPFPAMTQTPPSTLPNADFGNQDHGTTPIPTTTFTGYPVTIGGTLPLENLTADFGYNYNPAVCVNGDPSCADVTAALGDRVWIDVNGDGAQDPDEVGVRGVTLQIFTAGADNIFGTPDDVPGLTETTDANGYYLFDGLAPGAYVVKVVSNVGASHPVPTETDGQTANGYTQTGDPDHFGTTDISAPANDGRTTTPVILGPGDVFLNADFGYQPTGAQVGAIGDTVWFDADASGTPTVDPGEYGIPRVTVALIRDTNGNGVWDMGEPIIATDTTDANGNYLFTGLSLSDDGDGNPADADYIVWVNDTDSVLTGLRQTYDQDAPLDNRSATALSAGTPQDLLQDFSYTTASQTNTLGLIGDTVWFDLDGSGGDQTTQGNEPGIEGVLMELLNSSGTVIATTATNENGNYYFGGLPVSVGGIQYQTRVAASNFAAGGVLQGMTNTYDPDGTTPVGTGQLVNLTTAAPINLLQDFSYTTPAAQGSIGNQVWEDLNADGIRQAGEPAIAGVTIDLYRDLNGNGTVDPGEPLMGTQTTDASGAYLFDSLPIVGNGTAGSAAYVVDVTDVNGVLAGYWHSLSPNQDANTGVSGNTANDANDNSKADPFAVEIGSGAGGQPVSNNLNVDFGYYVKPAALGNFVWLDDLPGSPATDGNGIQDPGEQGINGIIVQLMITYPDLTMNTLSTVTGDDPSTAAVESGWYSFGNLLLDEDYATSSSSGTPTANQPVYKISVPNSGAYVPTLVGAGGPAAMDNSNQHAGTIGEATQGRTNVNQNSDPNAETNPIAGYDFGYTSAPLAVILADFNAAAQTDHILVAWETVSELDNAGFNLYRSATHAAPEQLLANIASQAPGSAQGAFYSYQDIAVEAGQVYYYWLETVDLNGSTELHGPVNATMLIPTAVTLNNVEADSGATSNLLWLLAVAAGLALAAVYGLRRGAAR